MVGFRRTRRGNDQREKWRRMRVGYEGEGGGTEGGEVGKVLKMEGRKRIELERRGDEIERERSDTKINYWMGKIETNWIRLRQKNTKINR